MKWYIGQEIVCVKAHGQGQLKVGKTYLINGLQLSPCKCKNVLIDIGISYDYIRFSGNTICGSCGAKLLKYNYHLYRDIYFAPLEQDISELTNILEQPIKQIKISHKLIKEVNS